MVKRRIIPKFLLEKRQLVKFVRFTENRRLAGNPVSTAKVYNSYGVDEMIFLDILASVEGRNSLIEVVREAAAEIFMPFTVGGGVRCLEDVNALLRAGADKVAVTTAAVETPEFIRRAAASFGDQCITVGIDYREVSPGVHRVFTHGGRKATGLDPIDFALRMQDQHCGEVLWSSIDHDGAMSGYDLELIQEAAERLDVPLVASGGCGSLEHCRQAFATGASAITISSMFLFSDNSPIKARSYLRSQGLEVRASASSRN